MLELPKTHLDPFALFAKAWELFKLTLPQVLSLSIILALLGVIMTRELTGQIDMTQPDWWRKLPESGLMPYLFLYGIISTYLSNILLLRIGWAYLPVPSKNAYTQAAAALLPVLIGNSLYFSLVFFGSLAFVIPGVFLMVSLLFYSPAILFDHKGIVASFALSSYLVKENWWHTAYVFSLPLLLFFILTGLWNEFFLAQGVVDTEELTGMGYFKELIDVLLDTLFTPLIYAVTVVTFYDLKLRRLPSSNDNNDDYLVA